MSFQAFHLKLRNMLSYRRSFLLGAIFFATMVAIGAIPGEATALSARIPDKLLHFVAYSFLTCCIFGSLKGGLWSRSWRSIVYVGMLGALDENIQRFMPYRSCDIADWAFDMLAATLSVLILSLIYRLLNPVPTSEELLKSI
ncbi:VanZ family protein [Undibacterium sp.]|uniref:VanZ family protein n=1 Tax=Undibacterium sp. TaxID=1914977 RepID=UPI0025F79DDE|nr:VanZ family protein [Undibacterium sp.]